MRDLHSNTALGTVRAILDEAMELVGAVEPAPLPFAAIDALHSAIGQCTRFAPAERATQTIALDSIQLVVERARPPSPRWAVELAFGAYLRASGSLHAAMALKGVIRLDTNHAAEIEQR